MPKRPYNGHANWNHWNVSLWINNDEGLYNMAKRCIRQSGTKDKAAVQMLEELKEMRISHTPDKAPYSKSAIRAAMAGM